MGPIYLILALVFSLLIALLAVANVETVQVNYLFGQTEVLLIILIIGSAIAGALVMGLFSLFRSIRTAFRFREGRRLQEELHTRIKTLEDEKLRLEAELGRLALPDAASGGKPAAEAAEAAEAVKKPETPETAQAGEAAAAPAGETPEESPGETPGT